MFKRNKRQDPGTEILRCSFCNNSQDDVRKLIAGPAVFICDECVDVCKDIMADDSRSSVSGGAANLPEAQPVPEEPTSGLVFPCTACGLPTLSGDGLVIRSRGLLCRGCVAEIETAIAERKQLES